MKPNTGMKESVDCERSVLNCNEPRNKEDRKGGYKRWRTDAGDDKERNGLREPLLQKGNEPDHAKQNSHKQKERSSERGSAARKKR